MARRDALLTALLAAATADEQRFLVRLLTGELRQGALEGVVLDAVAARRRRARGDACGGRSCSPAGCPRRRRPRSPAAPRRSTPSACRSAARCSRCSPAPASSLDAALADLGADVTVEFKLDGARIQVHRDGDEVRVWTRSLREITDGVPELVERIRALPCRTAVLDGETLALDDDGRPRAFQDTMSRFGSDGGATRGRAAQPVPLRRAAPRRPRPARRAAAGAPRRAGRAAGRRAARRAPDARRPLPRPGAGRGRARRARSPRATRASSSRRSTPPYAAGRRGKAWQKVKPVHTLDLVVLGAEWGYGRRTGKLSNIHLGARDPDGGEPVMVGKTFKGMTDELLEWQTRTFPEHARERPRLGRARCGPELVVEIALDGAQRSPRYPGGVALRFARVLRYRPDKTAAEADTIDAVRALLAGG